MYHFCFEVRECYVTFWKKLYTMLHLKCFFELNVGKKEITQSNIRKIIQMFYKVVVVSAVIMFFSFSIFLWKSYLFTISIC